MRATTGAETAGITQLGPPAGTGISSSNESFQRLGCSVIRVKLPDDVRFGRSLASVGYPTSSELSVASPSTCSLNGSSLESARFSCCGCASGSLPGCNTRQSGPTVRPFRKVASLRLCRHQRSQEKQSAHLS